MTVSEVEGLSMWPFVFPLLCLAGYIAFARFSIDLSFPFGCIGAFLIMGILIFHLVI